jgi:phosphoribosylaminoimidazole (AIR) synthetase
MGIGLVLVVPREQAMAVVDSLSAAGEHAALIGEVVRGSHEVQIV